MSVFSKPCIDGKMYSHTPVKRVFKNLDLHVFDCARCGLRLQIPASHAPSMVRYPVKQPEPLLDGLRLNRLFSAKVPTQAT